MLTKDGNELRGASCKEDDDSNDGSSNEMWIKHAVTIQGNKHSTDTRTIKNARRDVLVDRLTSITKGSSQSRDEKDRRKG